MSNMNVISGRIKLGNKVYGAIPDGRGTIGGGFGYKDIVKGGKYNPTTLEELVADLRSANPGEVVFLSSDLTIDMTVESYINKTELQIPEGVTLASNRGYNKSEGAEIVCKSFDLPAMIRTLGYGARVTGLRLKGPCPKRYKDHHSRAWAPSPPGLGPDYYYQFPVSRGIWNEFDTLEVDNCEISGFSHAGVYVHDGTDVYVHHNYIHHCQYEGLGYGVAQKYASKTLIEHNLFNWNRHSIASSGNPLCSYIARHNIQLENCVSHAFDMHGGPSSAGDFLEVENNTFYNVTVKGVPYLAVKVRGVPSNENGLSRVAGNWFAQHETVQTAVSHLGGVTVIDNAYLTTVSPSFVNRNKFEMEVE